MRLEVVCAQALRFCAFEKIVGFQELREQSGGFSNGGHKGTKDDYSNLPSAGS
jgi:hypothetical protein